MSKEMLKRMMIKRLDYYWWEMLEPSICSVDLSLLDPGQCLLSNGVKGGDPKVVELATACLVTLFVSANFGFL
jgi:hypothetical protein